MTFLKNIHLLKLWIIMTKAMSDIFAVIMEQIDEVFIFFKGFFECYFEGDDFVIFANG